MNLDNKKFIIFDLDGVLMCTKEMCMNSYRAVIDEIYGVDFRKQKFPDELLSTFVETPFSKKLKENGISDEDIDRILPLYYDYNNKFGYLNKKVESMINEVKRQHYELDKKVYLASLKSEEPGMKIFKQTEIMDCFDDVQFRTPLKTKSDVLKKLLSKIDETLTKENCVYIGDMPYDKVAAEENGIDYIDVSEIMGFSPNFVD